MTPLETLLPLLERLDGLIERAIAVAQTLHNADRSEEVDCLLEREPGVPLFELSHSTADRINRGSRLDWLLHTFALTEFDLDAIIIALAPHLDRRYERLYAYLQDDPRCYRPSVDLALNLLCETAVDKLEQRSHFTSDAPLMRHHLLHLVGDSTLLAKELHLDGQVVRFLLAESGLDPVLAPFCQLIQSPESEAIVTPELLAQVHQAWQTQQPLRLYFQGRDRISHRHTANRLANEIATPLLSVDLPRLIAAKVEVESILERVFREAMFQGALLYLEGVESLEGMADRRLRSLLATRQTVTLLSGTNAWTPGVTEPPLGLVTIAFPLPSFARRRHDWQTQVSEAIGETDLDALADRFCLSSGQIAEAIATARNVAQSIGKPLSLNHLFTAARAQSGHELEGLARKIEPKSSWNNLVLQPDPLAQLKELCNQAKHRHIVYGDWGFDRKLSLGKGINALFAGLPGTGKTMASEIIAAELQLDLYKIDLSQMVSKYIGETEKNLNRIFTAAANSNAILLFDEADALFGKRSEVQDAHDRYANIEIGYLLQKIEEYEGIAILTTNFRSSIDNAFVRRLRFIIEFPLPNDRDRHRIWQQIWSDRAPLSDDLDLDLVAKRLEITGAEIRNIAVAAAFLAASEGQSITMRHLLQAIRREYQKLGKILDDLV
ncbi:MAG: ATP-dependent zinc metalloprotease FtsH [Chroococcidiopsis sp. SAG 2025]|uniref:ATP-binding protein n=1 Tax=Chroococcidiopsis sp. SAG 2025 TaxID=171389 RepID=UPI0029372379|nr:AAA family ATPase [Chroococcidiopsis sp. SAG 2025]MDV2996750.1 ATP-dependent zinc metalloprotease FtsH [Chroococcidiopsis sp. SAG 2025]